MFFRICGVFGGVECSGDVDKKEIGLHELLQKTLPVHLAQGGTPSAELSVQPGPLRERGPRDVHCVTGWLLLQAAGSLTLLTKSTGLYSSPATPGLEIGSWAVGPLFTNVFRDTGSFSAAPLLGNILAL